VLNSIFGWFLTEGILYDLFKGEGSFGADGGRSKGRQASVGEKRKAAQGRRARREKGVEPRTPMPPPSRVMQTREGGIREAGVREGWLRGGGVRNLWQARRVVGLNLRI
jgi:hypothetical protein